MSLVSYITQKVIAFLRTHKANSNTGCLACGSEDLQQSPQDTLICQSCGYEGSLDRGGELSFQDVVKFTSK